MRPSVSYADHKAAASTVLACIYPVLQNLVYCGRRQFHGVDILTLFLMNAQGKAVVWTLANKT